MNQQAAAPNDHEEQRKKTGGKRRSATKRGTMKSPGSTSCVRKEVSQIDRRPRIVVGEYTLLPNPAQMKALVKAFEVYQFGNRLCEVVYRSDRPLVVPLSLRLVREVFPRPANWTCCTPCGQRRCREIDFGRGKPVDVLGVWRGAWPLVGVVEMPYLPPLRNSEKDVNVEAHHCDPYSDAVYYAPIWDMPPLKSRPTRGDALAALMQLHEMMPCLLRFSTPADKSAWLAALLTPHARFSFTGCAPLFLFDNSDSGKLLANVFNTVYSDYNRYNPVIVTASNSNKSSKKMLAIGKDCMPTALISNIANPSATASVEAMLQAREWTHGVPGEANSITVPLRTIWGAVGNKAELPTSIARRCLPVRLQKGGRHTDLDLNDIDRLDLELIAAALTILRAYVVAGSPSMGLKLFRPFTGWSKVVREAIVWLGLPDPVMTRCN